jgi:hypothetical protein
MLLACLVRAQLTRTVCVFQYGRIVRIDLKIGARPPAFAFVEYADPRDAEDAVRGRDGYAHRNTLTLTYIDAHTRTHARTHTQTHWHAYTYVPIQTCMVIMPLCVVVCGLGTTLMASVCVWRFRRVRVRARALRAVCAAPTSASSSSACRRPARGRTSRWVRRCGSRWGRAAHTAETQKGDKEERGRLARAGGCGDARICVRVCVCGGGGGEGPWLECLCARDRPWRWRCALSGLAD